MKRCVRCSRSFEDDLYNLSPSEEHADVYLRYIGYRQVNNLCPQCREETAFHDIMGFDKDEYEEDQDE